MKSADNAQPSHDRSRSLLLRAVGDRYSWTNKRMPVRRDREDEREKKREAEVYYTLCGKGRRQGNGYHFRVVFCNGREDADFQRRGELAVF